MKIGILYICTGKYNLFWKDFYLSCEKYFISDAEKHYFVFTDSESIEFESENSRIHRVPQENLGWPGNTLRRYEMFLKLKETLKSFDFLFFFNANLQFLEKIIADEFVPVGQEKLVACLHPGYYDKKVDSFTYERNSRSSAFIPKGQGAYYFAGGINGGRSKDFIESMEVMSNNIKKDFSNNITAVWHDESHWNCYLNNNLHIVKILTPAYLYPEDFDIPFERKILIKDKTKLGGHFKLRNKLEMRLIVSNLKKIIKKFKY
ncbi:MAG: family 6 glucosyltransferase [Candidatus Magasanikbacteria bacterium]